MPRLDAEEGRAREPVERRRLTPPEIVACPRCRACSRSGDPKGVRPDGLDLQRTDVLGFEKLEYELTPDAIDLGLGATLPAVLDLSVQIAGFGRGERGSPFL